MGPSWKPQTLRQNTVLASFQWGDAADLYDAGKHGRVFPEKSMELRVLRAPRPSPLVLQTRQLRPRMQGLLKATTEPVPQLVAPAASHLFLHCCSDPGGWHLAA